MMHAELSIEEQIQLAANNKLYTNRNPEKGIRVITVLLYFLSISLAAIILSCYYVYFWHPEYKNATIIRNVNCGKCLIFWHLYFFIHFFLHIKTTEIVKEISLRTVNATELFYNKLLKKLRHSDEQRWHSKRHKSRILKDNEELILTQSEPGIEPFFDDINEKPEMTSDVLMFEDEDSSTNHNEIGLSDSDEELY